MRGHVVGSNPWLPIEDSVIPATAKVVGAKDSEVTVMNSLTVNIHLGLVSWLGTDRGWARNNDFCPVGAFLQAYSTTIQDPYGGETISFGPG